MVASISEDNNDNPDTVSSLATTAADFPPRPPPQDSDTIESDVRLGFRPDMGTREVRITYSHPHYQQLFGVENILHNIIICLHTGRSFIRY